MVFFRAALITQQIAQIIVSCHATHMGNQERAQAIEYMEKHEPTGLDSFGNT